MGGGSVAVSWHVLLGRVPSQEVLRNRLFVKREQGQRRPSGSLVLKRWELTGQYLHEVRAESHGVLTVWSS